VPGAGFVSSSRHKERHYDENHYKKVNNNTLVTTLLIPADANRLHLRGMHYE
jgi:hypothetical protein